MMQTDELDQLWREGLVTLAEQLTPPTDPEPRVALRRRRRRRVRIATKLSAVVALVAVGAITIVAFAGRSDHRSGVTSQPPPIPAATVVVDDAPGHALRIAFPGRDTNGLSLRLPAGLIRFQVRGDEGHDLVLDGASGFRVELTASAAPTRTTDVLLAPGQYLMHCLIPGHTEAGEQAPITVTAP